MYQLSRAFVVAAVIGSAVLCAPVSQDAGKPVSTGSIFGITHQNPNYQTHPTELRIVPALAKDAGQEQGQEQLTVQQAIQLCPEAKTIAVSSKNSKRSPQVPNGGALAPPPVLEPQPGAPRPVVARSQAPPPNPQGLPQPKPLPPHPVAARSDSGQPPKDEIPPPPVSQSLPGTPKPHAPRDLPPQPVPVPQPAAVPAPAPEALHPIAARSQAPPPPPKPEVAQPEPLPLHQAAAHSIPEQPPKAEALVSEPVPDSPAPRPPVARSPQGQPQPIPQAQPVPERIPQPPHLVVARSGLPQVPRPDAEVAPQPVLQPGAPFSTGN
ncbi:unnamed protein product [Rhizoctonia solani]|uniref:Uncharacterized protein n=1 Tax=Rhizoctonia solani TaxID=456999 RepID=A0A8H3B5I5_9AGAM|nr:unnamed protein product [Rhizoctonia solani]